MRELLVQFETARARQPADIPHRISVRSAELVYELAYLSLFKKWEELLEECLLRLMCGYSNSRGVPTFQPGVVKANSIAAALTALYGTNQYLLWHSAWKAADRARQYLVNHDYEVVLLSNQASLDHFANVRHRIAHGQEDSRRKFDAATMALAGQRYLASSPGRFLRDWVPGTVPKRRWFEEISSTLTAMSLQIVD